MKSYTELEVWQKSRKLAGSIYRLTATFPKEEIFALTSQLRRSAVSIPSNIAEGCGRSTAKDSIHFFYIARGSLYELETQLYISFDLNYIKELALDQLLSLLTECKKLLHGFISYFRTLKS